MLDSMSELHSEIDGRSSEYLFLPFSDQSQAQSRPVFVSFVLKQIVLQTCVLL